MKMHFHWSCINGHIEIIEFLELLDWNYSHEIKDNKIIPIIKDKFEEAKKIPILLDELADIYISNLHIKILLSL